MNNPQHIDLGSLREMARGDNRFIEKMLLAFSENTPGLLDTLETSVGENRLETIVVTAHRMQPGFHYVGRSDISEMLHTLEHKTNELSADEMRRITRELRSQAELIFADVRETLKELRSE